MMTRHLWLLVFALTLATACGSVDAGPDEDAPDGGGADHRDDADAGAVEGAAPTVVEVTPADGADGVMPDADIAVVFSQPMDTDSVEAAWSSAKLPADAVTFTWNPAGDVLTVTPDDPLPLAKGTGLDPDSVQAIAVAFTIGAGAVDEAGTPLAGPLEVQFRTARRMTVGVGYDISLSDCRTSTGSAAAGAGEDTLYAGDTYSNSSVRLAVSFELPELPAGAALEHATLSATQLTAPAGMYTTFGDLAATHVRFGSVAGAYSAGALHGLGIFSDSGQAGQRSVAATAAVAEDLADGVSHSQFRMQFSTFTDYDEVSDFAQFPRSSFKLNLTYLAE